MPSEPVEGVVYGHLFKFLPPTRVSQFSDGDRLYPHHYYIPFPLRILRPSFGSAQRSCAAVLFLYLPPTNLAIYFLENFWSITHSRQEFSSSNFFYSISLLYYIKGSFSNYVDKMRGEGVKKVCFSLCSGYKNCPCGGGGVKKW